MAACDAQHNFSVVAFVILHAAASSILHAIMCCVAIVCHCAPIPTAATVYCALRPEHTGRSTTGVNY